MRGLATVLICSCVSCLRPRWSGNRHPKRPLVAGKPTCPDAAGMSAHDPKRTFDCPNTRLSKSCLMQPIIGLFVRGCVSAPKWWIYHRDAANYLSCNVEIERKMVEQTTMNLAALIVAFVVGPIAGWLVGLLVHATGIGLSEYILIGIAGATLAAFWFRRLGLGLTIASGVVGAIVWATIGALTLLLVARFLCGIFA